MKQTPKLKEIPIVMMSADGESGVVAQFLQNGAQHYLIKPINAQIAKSLVKYIKLTKKISSATSSLNEYTILKSVYFIYKKEKHY